MYNDWYSTLSGLLLEEKTKLQENGQSAVDESVTMTVNLRLYPGMTEVCTFTPGTHVWNTVWFGDQLESILPQGKWFNKQPDPDRHLFFWQSSVPGYKERIELRLGNLQNKEITGDIRKNTTQWRFDDWELIGVFQVKQWKLIKK